MKYSITVISLLIVIVIILLIKEGFAIRCFECKSYSDDKCADPFDNKTLGLTECVPRHVHNEQIQIPKMCRKIRQKVNGAWRYIRGCAILGEVGIRGDERFCLMRTGTYNIFMEYCTCNSRDGCNNSNLLRTSNILIGSVMSWLLFNVFNI